MWTVIVEELVGMGDSRRWQVTRQEEIADRGAACVRARSLAHGHVAAHPAAERNRTVHRRDDTEFLVTVKGMMQEHYFRVGVWQLDEPIGIDPPW